MLVALEVVAEQEKEPNDKGRALQFLSAESCEHPVYDILLSVLDYLP